MNEKQGNAVVAVFLVALITVALEVVTDNTLSPRLMWLNFGAHFPAIVTALLLGNCVYCLVTLLLGRALGGKATAKRTFIVGAYALIPLVLLITKYTASVAIIWSFILGVIGQKIAQGVTIPKALAVQAAFTGMHFALAAALIWFMFFGRAAKHSFSAAETLLHKPAPDVAIKPFKGDPFMLSSLKGKSVVVLDFWATWCPPCRIGLPVVCDVVKSFADKGVVCYALTGDKADEAQEFLTAKNLSVTGASETDEQRKAFYVEGIPETIVIDKNGVIQGVHVGLSPHEKEELTAEIERSLAQK